MLITTDRQAAVKEVYRLHDAGHAATIHSFQGRHAALDLDAPIVDVVDLLDDLGLDSDDAMDTALRLVAKGS